MKYMKSKAISSLLFMVPLMAACYNGQTMNSLNFAILILTSIVNHGHVFKSDGIRLCALILDRVFASALTLTLHVLGAIGFTLYVYKV